MKAAATVAQQGRDATRAHARLDQVESTQSQQSGQIATANTNITTNTTNITTNTTAIASLNTHLGSTAQQTFLGSLSKMAHIGTPSGSASHSGIGTIGHIGAAPTQSDFNNMVDDYNALNTAYNNAMDFLNSAATALAGLLSELQAANYES